MQFAKEGDATPPPPLADAAAEAEALAALAALVQQRMDAYPHPLWRDLEVRGGGAGGGVMGAGGGGGCRAMERTATRRAGWDFATLGIRGHWGLWHALRAQGFDLTCVHWPSCAVVNSPAVSLPASVGPSIPPWLCSLVANTVDHPAHPLSHSLPAPQIISDPASTPRQRVAARLTKIEKSILKAAAEALAARGAPTGPAAVEAARAAEARRRPGTGPTLGDLLDGGHHCG